MKKHILAAAVATAIAAPAFAQSTVELFGRIDVGYSDKTVNAKQTGIKTTDTGINSSNYTRSRLGFKGSEDLGGGMKANFFIETTLTPVATTFSTVANAESWVGLSSANMGELRLGTQYTPMFYLDVGFDTTGANGTVGRRMGAIEASYAASVNNAVSYRTPTMSGANAYFLVGKVANKVKGNETSASDALIDTIEYLYGELDYDDELGRPYTTKSSTDVFGLGLNYASGPFTAGYVYHSIRGKTTAHAAAAWKGGVENLAGALLGTSFDPEDYVTLDSTATAKTRTTEQAIAAGYDFKVAKATLTWYDLYTKSSGSAIGTLYDSGADEFYTDTTAAATKKTTTTGYRFGLSVPLGAVTLIGQAGDATSKVKGGVRTNLDSYQVGALYSFSKRTTGYALVGSLTSKAKGSKATESDQVAIGVRHDF